MNELMSKCVRRWVNENRRERERQREMHRNNIKQKRMIDLQQIGPTFREQKKTTRKKMRDVIGMIHKRSRRTRSERKNKKNEKRREENRISIPMVFTGK